MTCLVLTEASADLGGGGQGAGPTYTRGRGSGVARGGGHGPRAQALEGAPAQLVGANFKKKIRPRQIRFFFLLVDFSPRGGCRIYPRGGGGRRSKHWPPGAGDPRYATGTWSSRHSFSECSGCSGHSEKMTVSIRPLFVCNIT